MEENQIWEAVCSNDNCRVRTFIWTLMIRQCPSCTWLGDPTTLLEDGRG
jgi:hypothetical protein